MKPTYENNFGRVFELPEYYTEGFLFGGGEPVTMQMVDWFNPWPFDRLEESQGDLTWNEVVEMMKPWLLQKPYVKPGKRYILITDFGESLMFGHGCD